VWYWQVNAPPYLHDGEKGFEYYGAYFFLLAIALAILQISLAVLLLWLLYRPQWQSPVVRLTVGEADLAADSTSG
jgi:hypothetical protein